MEASLNMEKPMFSFFEVEEEPKMQNSIHFNEDKILVSTTSLQEMKSDMKDVDSSLSIGEDLTIDYKQSVLVSSAKAKMGQVREENQKLKHDLSRVLKDYKSLQMHFNDLFQQEVAKSSEKQASDHEDDGNELISLTLGRVSSYKHKSSDGPKKVNCFRKNKQDSDNEDDEQELKLGLSCEVDPTPTKVDFNTANKDEQTQTMEQPVHGLKTERSDDNELLDLIPLKKARVSVKVVCDTQTMNDGCQWRKYGQKIAKGNPCPRAYYRCTMSPSCPVRKHVQRCSEDKSVLITTYEGTHDHPLSVSATAMASTTSAAASMLNATSSTSQLGRTITAAFSSHHGIGYNSRETHYPFYLPKTTISTYQSHPTITLDLTSNPLFNISNSSNFTMTPRFSSSTCLNFSSPSSSSSSSFSSSIESNNKTTIPFSYHEKETPSHDDFKNNSGSASKQQLADTIAAATKALTSNPSFRSALGASIASFVGGGAKI